MVDYHQEILARYSIRIRLFSQLSLRILSCQGRFIAPAVSCRSVVCCLLSLTAVLELHVHGQQASDEQATGFNRAAETLVAPGYQPQTPARINMALMDDTKPRLHRLAPVKCQDAHCNEPACPGCQQPLDIPT